jgi:hypothetical protein
MVEANRYEIPEIASGRWLRDLAIAMKPISETLNATFIKHSTNDAKNNSRSYLRAGIRIREFVGTNNNPSKGRVTRGTAFAAEFNGEPASEEDATQDSNKSKSRKRAGTASALQNAPKGKRNNIGSCQACGLRGHQLSKCFYALPELRYDGFVPIERFEKKVRHALMNNSKLENEIEAIRKGLEEKEAFE